MAEIVSTIASVTDFTNWVASLPSDLVTDGNSYTAEITNAAELVFPASGSPIANFTQTCDATHFITIRAKAGNSFRDAGDGPLKYDPARGAALNISPSYNYGIECSQGYSTPSYLVLEGLQVYSAGLYCQGIIYLNGATCLVDGCLAQGYVRSGYSYVAAIGQNTVVKNSAVVTDNSGGASCSGVAFSYYGGYQSLNNTLICPTGATQCRAVSTSSATLFKNTAAFGFASLNATNVAAGSANNATDQTAGFVAGDLANVVFANQFQGVTQVSPDARLKSGSVLIDAGVTDSNVTVDIFNTTRPQGSYPDIGCYEVAAAAPAAGSDLIFNMF